MARSLRCDTSADDAYVQFDFAADESEVWVTLTDCTWDVAAEAVWESEEFSGDFGLIRAHTDTMGVDTNAQGASLGVDGATNKWYQDRSASHFGPAAIADTLYLVELHYDRGVVTEIYIDSTVIDPAAVDGDAIRDAFWVRVGASNGAPNDADAIVLIGDVKIGTTRGGAELFSDDFEDGTLDAWSSTFGDVSVVGEGDGPTEIPVTEIIRDGVAPAAATDSDAANGMFVAANDGRILVEIVSEDAAPQTVGFAITETIDDQPAHDKTVTVPAGARRVAGPFPEWLYNQLDGSLQIHPSVDTTLKLRAYACKRDVVILDG